MNDVFIAVVDGLKGFSEAINAVFPDTQVQTCIVHMIRNSLNYVGWKERKAVAADLKEVYRASTCHQDIFGHAIPDICDRTYVYPLLLTYTGNDQRSRFFTVSW